MYSVIIWIIWIICFILVIKAHKFLCIILEGEFKSNEEFEFSEIISYFIVAPFILFFYIVFIGVAIIYKVIEKFIPEIEDFINKI